MTQKIVFKRGNLVADDHPLPTIEEASMSLACSLPSSVVLIADEPGKIIIYLSILHAVAILRYLLNLTFM